MHLRNGPQVGNKISTCHFVWSYPGFSSAFWAPEAVNLSLQLSRCSSHLQQEWSAFRVHWRRASLSPEMSKLIDWNGAWNLHSPVDFSLRNTDLEQPFRFFLGFLSVLDTTMNSQRQDPCCAHNVDGSTRRYSRWRSWSGVRELRAGGQWMPPARDSRTWVGSD